MIPLESGRWITATARHRETTSIGVGTEWDLNGRPYLPWRPISLTTRPWNWLFNGSTRLKCPANRIEMDRPSDQESAWCGRSELRGGDCIMHLDGSIFDCPLGDRATLAQNDMNKDDTFSDSFSRYSPGTRCAGRRRVSPLFLFRHTCNRKKKKQGSDGRDPLCVHRFDVIKTVIFPIPQKVAQRNSADYIGKCDKHGCVQMFWFHFWADAEERVLFTLMDSLTNGREFCFDGVRWMTVNNTNENIQAQLNL